MEVSWVRSMIQDEVENGMKKEKKKEDGMHKR